MIAQFLVPVIASASTTMPNLDVSSALQDGTTLMVWVMSTITSIGILATVFVLGTLAPMGIKLLKGVKKAAR